MEFIGLDGLAVKDQKDTAWLQELAAMTPGPGHPLAPPPPPPPEEHPFRDACIDVVFVVSTMAVLLWSVYGGVLEKLRMLFLAQ